MDNPYWHPEYKSHVIDFDDIKLMCFNIYNLVMTSMQFSHFNSIGDEDEREDLEFPLLLKLHYDIAEHELSKMLLRIAVLMRTLDDILINEKNGELIKQFRQPEDHTVVYEGLKCESLSFREICNKIIHAEDLRPVYDTDLDRDDPKALWGMDSTIELKGKQAGKEWSVSFSAIYFAERALELVEMVCTEEKSVQDKIEKS